MSGYVYLIQDSDNNTYKIGVTKGSPMERLRKLQTGNPNKLNMIYHYLSSYPYRLESMLHSKFNMYHKLNEWYSLPYHEVENFGSTCMCLEDIIIVMKDNAFFGKNLK